MGRGRARPESPGRAPLAAMTAPMATIGRALRELRWFVNGVTGADAYERYCTHLRAVHPEEQPPSERDFWRLKWADEERNPTGRCC